MCLRNVYYPLYEGSNGKRKLLFGLQYKIKGRTDFDRLSYYTNEVSKACKLDADDTSLNRWFLKRGLNGGNLVKMVQIPCGCCRECLNDISRQWSFRIMQEAQLHDDNYFITFTYDEEHIPSNMMLDTKAISNLNKKLKVYLSRKGLKSDFRFYGVGEYGSTTARPHYHIIYFGLPIPDLKFEMLTKDKNMVFSSKFLDSVWANGFVTIETLDIGSACYVARYCDKKKRLTPAQKQDLVNRGIVPEFSRMSNRPGIGANYLETAVDRFKDGIYKDYINGKSYSYPLYYNKKIKSLMADTPELLAYEENARVKSSIKMAQQMQLSDFVGDLDSYFKNQDIHKNHRGL